MALALLTHPILDYFTIYGTQLLRPFDSIPYGLGSLFIIDPLYTLPLLIGLILCLVRTRQASSRPFPSTSVTQEHLPGMLNTRGLRANLWGLLLSGAYLLWSAGAQMVVKARVEQQLVQSGLSAYSIKVTPTPFNTLLWRVMLRSQNEYQEGFYSLFDGEGPIVFSSYSHDKNLELDIRHLPQVQRMAWFTHGFYVLRRQGDDAILMDVRMGQEPYYVFAFRVAKQVNGVWQAVPAEKVGEREPDVGKALGEMWRRIWSRSN
jgi:inner membrane protein